MLVPSKQKPSSDTNSRKPSRSRTMVGRVLQVMRRLHLYLGLWFFPLAILYGVTAFLFNHPAAIPDIPITSFSAADLKETALEKPIDRAVLTQSVVRGLNDRFAPSIPYKAENDVASYVNRDAFIVMVKAEDRTFSVLYDPLSGGGAIRETTRPVVAPVPSFTIGASDGGRQRMSGMRGMGPMKRQDDGLIVEEDWVKRLSQAIPTLLQRKGLPSGTAMVTAAPDIQFTMRADGDMWSVRYNPLTTSVSANLVSAPSALSWRAFLLRLHTTRGYPSEFNSKWIWALLVDLMSLTLVFWGISGLCMWWQIKATRFAGAILLTAGIGFAVLLGWSMQSFIN